MSQTEQQPDSKSPQQLNRQPVPPDDSPGDESIEAVPLFKNVKVVIPLFLVVLAIAIFAWRYYINLRDFVSTDDAYVDGNRVSVSTKILGRIDQLNADEGDTVREGQILVRLDDSDLRAQEAQTKAALGFAKENIEVSKVNLDKAQTDFKRSDAQFRQSIIPKEDFDHAQNELEAAKARLNLAYAQVAQLKNTIIEAPMTGVVSKRWVLAGDVVQPGQSIFSVYDVKNIWVTANLEETNLAYLHAGDKAEMDVDTYPSLKFSGTILLIGSNTASQFSLIPPNNASGNFTKVTQRVPVKISIVQDSIGNGMRASLLPGMSVEVRVKVR
jgi:membrane fusion protein (multidrug efflux system)